MRRFLLSLALVSSLLTMLAIAPGHGPVTVRADGCTTQPGGTCPT
jgi:hypothetical protein